MIDRRTYNQMLDLYDDPQFIAKEIYSSLSKEERAAIFGAPEQDGIPAPAKTPLHWRKNPGYDTAGNLVCAGCGEPMSMQPSKDGHTHAACARQGCELYGRDYIEASEHANPHRHTPASFNGTSYVCACGVIL